MTGRLILLRHGQTYSNVARRLDTRPPGAELTDTGRNQAWNVGAELAEFCGAGNGSPGRLGAVVSSVALRAQQTALLAMNAFEQTAGLREHEIVTRLRHQGVTSYADLALVILESGGSLTVLRTGQRIQQRFLWDVRGAGDLPDGIVDREP